MKGLLLVLRNLQHGGAVRAEVTIASLVEKLDEARSEALRLGQTSAAVAATMGKAKVTGQIVDRAEIRQPDEFGSMTVRSTSRVHCHSN